MECFVKRLFFFALMLGVAACGDAKGSPTAPSSVQTEGSSTSMTSGATAALTASELDADKVPSHIMHPVLFPMNQGLVVFPPRNEPNVFFQNLQALYRDFLRRPQDAPTYVDSEGQNVWLTEYFRFYLNGCSHEDASSRTLAEITTGSTLATCGSENLAFPPRNLPNDFQNRLQAVYRDVLRRPQTLSYVDSEGANVWLAQYLRFRVSGGCDHATAESKVFTEIRGGGVQPVCMGPPVPNSNVAGRIENLETVADLITYHQDAVAGSAFRIAGIIARWELPIPVYVDASASARNVEQALAYWKSVTGLSYVLSGANTEPRILVRAGTDGLIGTAEGRGGVDGTYPNNRARSGLVVIRPDLVACDFSQTSCAVLYERVLGGAIGLFGQVAGGGIMSGGSRASSREINMLVELYRLPHGTHIEPDGSWRVVR